MLLKELHNCNFSQHLLIHRHLLLLLLLLCCLLCSFVALFLLLLFCCCFIVSSSLSGTWGANNQSDISTEHRSNCRKYTPQSPKRAKHFPVFLYALYNFPIFFVHCQRQQRTAIYLHIKIVGVLIFYVCISCFYSNCC